MIKLVCFYAVLQEVDSAREVGLGRECDLMGKLACCSDSPREPSSSQMRVFLS
jgi:hypothetical protein